MSSTQSSPWIPTSESILRYRRITGGDVLGHPVTVLVRPYGDALMLRTMHYADEIRSTDEVDRGAKTSVGASELKLAERLINDLSKDKFEADKFKVLFSYS
jgi:non-homologous end joining protein Ku